MATTTLNVRIDEKLKKKIQVLAKEMGISFSSLVSGSLTHLARNGKCEFSGLTPNGFTDTFEDGILKTVKKQDIAFVSNSPKETKKYLKSISSKS